MAENVEKSQSEVAQVVRQFIENYDYYEATMGQLRLHFEDFADKRLIPGYNFGPDDVLDDALEGERAKIKTRDWTLGLYTNEHRETYYANWYGPEAGDHGVMPDDAEIVTPEEVRDGV